MLLAGGKVGVVDLISFESLLRRIEYKGFDA